MEFAFTPEQLAFVDEVRAWLKIELTEDIVQRGRQTGSIEMFGYVPEFSRKLGEKGWLAIQWPKEYGGLGRSHIEALILKEELVYAEAPILAHAFGTDFLGPAIIHHGSEEQKRQYLPAIARGEIKFCEGFSEPEAGSDLASLQTRAEEISDEWIINGVKRYTSTAHWADYIFLLARSDQQAARHRGISMFIIPMNTPGITIRPMKELTGIHRLNEVFLDNVRVPAHSLLGQKNRGWYQAMTTLDFERVGLPFAAHCKRILEYLIKYARETYRHGQSLNMKPGVRQALAQMDIEVEAARLLAYRIAWMQDQNIVPNYEASVSKVFCDEMFHRLGNIGTSLLGLYWSLESNSEWAPFQGEIMRHYLTAFGLSGGGTQEIQKIIIATKGLGLPRS